MRRTVQQALSNSTRNIRNKHESDATSYQRGLEERVTKLEAAVAQLNRRTLGLDSSFELPSKKPGPKPKHGPLLLQDRDRSVQMLESFWPEFLNLCSPSPDAPGLKRLLIAVRKSNPGRYQLPANHLLDNLPELIRFLKTDRFRNDPRQIANAMAGVPLISSWRSLKLCQASPCNLPIADRAIKAYIERKHPELYGRLAAEHSQINFATALKGYRTRDARLKEMTPTSLYYAWKTCAADFRS
jgi:hypothetical protein